ATIQCCSTILQNASCSSGRERNSRKNGKQPAIGLCLQFHNPASAQALASCPALSALLSLRPRPLPPISTSSLKHNAGRKLSRKLKDFRRATQTSSTTTAAHSRN